jgi:hypothetical protein
MSVAYTHMLVRDIPLKVPICSSLSLQERFRFWLGEGPFQGDMGKIGDRCQRDDSSANENKGRDNMPAVIPQSLEKTPINVLPFSLLTAPLNSVPCTVCTSYLGNPSVLVYLGPVALPPVHQSTHLPPKILTFAPPLGPSQP